MSTINSAISENLKHHRALRKMSLDALARESGVSKSMLGQIERGEVNPTITTVWKIAIGLKLPFSELTSRPESDLEVIKMPSTIIENDGTCRSYLLFPYDSERRFEVLNVELDPGARLCAQAHLPGAQEFISIAAGELLLTVHGQSQHLTASNSLRFKADSAHDYYNPGKECCRINMIIYYPQ